VVAARAVLFALVVVATGCGSADELGDPPPSLALSVKATAEAGSARVETVNLSEWGGRTQTFSSSGVYDYRTGRSQTTSDFEGHRSREIAIGSTSYSELDPSDALEVAHGKRWIRNGPISEAEFEAKTNDTCETVSADGDESSDDEVVSQGCSIQFVLFSSSTEAEDPGRLLDFLGRYGSKLRILGREDVRGVGTFHGETRVDFRRALEDSLREDGWSEKNIARAAEGHSKTPTRVEVWIDGDGLVRRTRTHWTFEPDELSEMPLPTDPGDYSSLTTTEYFDFGVEVHIEPPPESEVIDSDEWMRESMKRMRERLPFEPKFP
jgi:hypothetical protein